MLGHSGLPGIKANFKLSFQVGESIKRGLNKTRKQQGRTTNVVSNSGPHPCTGESREGNSVFFRPEILLYSVVLTAIGREVNATGLTSPTDHAVYFMLLYSKHLS